LTDDRHDDNIPVCDYEGSDYRTRFWENEDRVYEDLVERIAIRHLLPPSGGRLLEIGTGFGRLVDLYQGYEHIVLLDYSKSLLRQAQGHLGRGKKYTYVAADVYQMPLRDELVDAACMIRVMHHVANVPRALDQISRVIRPGGAFLLEFASKYHLKSILRHALDRQDWSPYDVEPLEFVPLNFDFHPRWMKAQLGSHSFEIECMRTVSHLRIPFLKQIVPASILAAIDGALQWTGQWWQCAPSVFVRSRRIKNTSGHAPPDLDRDPAALFRCLACRDSDWQSTASEMRCLGCGTRWQIDDGIYDFKTPL
jgi:ubiquinone/menaquinone biosynthesis C-methylase UbiE